MGEPADNQDPVDSGAGDNTDAGADAGAAAVDDKYLPRVITEAGTGAHDHCHGFEMSLVGGDAPEGLADWTDGYKASYTLELRDYLQAFTWEGTCLYFDDDAAGYFCMGATGDVTLDGLNIDGYSSHGAFYTAYTEAELAEIAKLEAVVDDAVDDGADPDDAVADAVADAVDDMDNVEMDTADGDDIAVTDIDPVDVMTWLGALNLLDADEGAEYTPVQTCEMVVEDNGEEFPSQDCAEVTTFTGSWFQPKSSDSGVYRINGTNGAGGWAFCVSWALDEAKLEGDGVAFDALTGATALTAGAAAVALTLMY